MRCQTSPESLQAFVDGALPEAEMRDVATHAEACASCRLEVQRLRRLDEILGASTDVEPSPTFERDFLRRLRLEPEDRAPRRPRWLRASAWALAAAGAAAAVVLLVRTVASDPEPAPGGDEPIAQERPAPPADPELLRAMGLLRALPAVTHLEALEGLTEEEFEAASELPELGG